MARPKSGRPTKIKLNITVTSEVKTMLQEVSESRQQSISELIEEYAIKEHKRLRGAKKRTETALE